MKILPIVHQGYGVIDEILIIGNETPERLKQMTDAAFLRCGLPIPPDNGTHLGEVPQPENFK